LTGLGETFFGPKAAIAYIHETAAPRLLGKSPLTIDRHSRTLIHDYYLGFAGSGAEMRGASAVDIALWDIWGKATNQPVHQLLGGLSRDKVRTYNTCAGYRYVRGTKGQMTQNWGLDAKQGPYEDLDAFLNNAGDLALSLKEEGITGMKIWPFDFAAERTDGSYISPRSCGRPWRRSARSEMRWATTWTSWSSCIRFGTCQRRNASSPPSSLTGRSGSRTRSR
jgi:galactonate dehydratase